MDKRTRRKNRSKSVDHLDGARLAAAARVDSRDLWEPSPSLDRKRSGKLPSARVVDARDWEPR
jgi:hypothetical protein